MFTNEKIFTSNGFWNPKNDVAWTNDGSHANERDGLHLMKKYPISIMIALGVTCSGFTRPCFLQKGERLTGQIYYDRLLPFYKRKGDCLFGHKNWDSNTVGLAPVRITELNDGAKTTSDPSFRRKYGHRTRLS